MFSDLLPKVKLNFHYNFEVKMFLKKTMQFWKPRLHACVDSVHYKINLSVLFL